MKAKEIALNGLARQNPVFKLLLGTCSVLALSTDAINGLGMGVAVTFVLVCSNLFISLLRNIIPDKIRIPAYVLVIATFVTVVKMVLIYLASKIDAFKGIYDAMGVFLPLIVVNCIILGRAEAFASHNKVGLSVLDGLFSGIGYMLALLLMGTIREFLGKGSVFGLQIIKGFSIGFFSQPAGAFLTYGLLIALFNIVYNAIERANKLRHAQQPLFADVKEGA